MLTITHLIKDENGIHARPAGLLATETKKYNSEITISCGEKKANAKKIFEIMSMCLKKGDTITVTIDGEDEKKAFDSMAVFLNKNL